MKNSLAVPVFVIAIFCGTKSFCQNFSTYIKDGIYQFEGTSKILKSEIFSTYAQGFGLAQNNSMVLKGEREMDSLGGVGGSYIQYCNGYPVEALK